MSLCSFSSFLEPSSQLPVPSPLPFPFCGPGGEGSPRPPVAGTDVRTTSAGFCSHFTPRLLTHTILQVCSHLHVILTVDTHSLLGLRKNYSCFPLTFLQVLLPQLAITLYSRCTHTLLQHLFTLYSGFTHTLLLLYSDFSPGFTHTLSLMYSSIWGQYGVNMRQYGVRGGDMGSLWGQRGQYGVARGRSGVLYGVAMGQYGVTWGRLGLIWVKIGRYEVDMG